MNSVLHPIIRNARKTIKSVCDKSNLNSEIDYDILTGFYRSMTDEDHYWITEITVKYSDHIENQLLEIGMIFDKYYFNEGDPSFQNSDRLGYLRDKITGPDAPAMNVKMARYYFKFSVEHVGYPLNN